PISAGSRLPETVALRLSPARLQHHNRHRQPSVLPLAPGFPSPAPTSAPVGNYHSHRSPPRLPLSACCHDPRRLARYRQTSSRLCISSAAHLHPRAGDDPGPFLPTAGVAPGSCPATSAAVAVLLAIGRRPHV